MSRNGGPSTRPVAAAVRSVAEAGQPAGAGATLAGGDLVAPDCARVQMLRMLQAPLITHALAVAAELEIAELLAPGPKSIDRLAREANADPDGLHRMLRALSAAGVFRELSGRRFANTELAETLREGSGSLRNRARLWTIEERTAAVGALMYSVRTGKPAFPRLHNASWSQQLADRPDQASVVAAAMGELAGAEQAEAAASYDLSAVASLVHVGGGRGQLLAKLLPANRRLRAVLFDQPAVVRHAGPVLAAAGVQARVSVVGGDLLEGVPIGGEVYLLARVLRDWDDQQAIRILRNLKQAMPAQASLLVIEAILPADDLPHRAKLDDLLALALHPGRERTEAEYARLLSAAGLRLRESRRLTEAAGLLIAKPAC